MSVATRLLVTRQYTEQKAHWQKLLSLSECVCVQFPHVSDRLNRMFQWYAELQRSTQFIPILLNLGINAFDEDRDLEQFVFSQLSDAVKGNNLSLTLEKLQKKIILIVTYGEMLAAPEHERVKFLLQRLLYWHGDHISLFTAFNANVYVLFPSFHDYYLLFQNIVYYPLYTDKDISTYVAYLCDSWNIKMPAPVRRSIVATCAGSFWLTHEACRLYRDTHSWNAQADEFKHQVSILTHSFTDKEAIILYSLPHIKPYEKTVELTFLQKTGFITPDNICRIPIILSYLNERLQPSAQLRQYNGHIEYKGISLSQLLSPVEYKLLTFFMTRPNTPIDRNTLAQIIWPIHTEEHYSQWAIDQAIKRLRDRLTALGLPPTTICSVRGVGYEYRTE